jgi:O-antigen/teichoic acid export membrane protein
MAGLRERLLTGSAFGAVALVMGTITNLATTRFVYSSLGVTAYAASVLFTSAIAFSNLLALGAHEAVLYYLAKPRSADWNRQAEALAALFALGGALGAALWLLAWLGFPAWVSYGSRIEPEMALAMSQAIGAVGLMWLMQHFTQAAWAFYRARWRMEEVGKMQMATSTLPLLAAVLALKAGVGLTGFYLVQAAVWFGVACWAFLAASAGPEGFALRPRWHSSELASSLGYARWAFVLQVAFTLQAYSDRFMATPLGSSALSVYGLATSFSLRIAAALGLVSTLILPAISKVHAEHGMERAGRAHGLALRATFWVGAAFYVPLAAGGPALLGRWVDPAMELQAQGWFAWVCVGGFWAAVGGSVQGSLMGLGRARVVALINVLGLAAGLLAFWALRGQGLWAVASFGTVASGVGLLANVLWLHGRVLQRFKLVEVSAASAFIFALGWGLHRSDWASQLGQGLLPCLAALGLASLAILGLGAAWDAAFSQGMDRDSLWSIATARWTQRP